MNTKLLKNLSFFIVALIVGVAGYKLLFVNNYDLPKGETISETILVDNGEVIDTDSELTSEELEEIKKKIDSITTKEIMITDGVKHSIPLDSIMGGGPPKDGIPSIDNPKFISIKETGDFLSDDDLGLALDINGIKKFYPFKILVWHEIVNDTFNDQKVLVTYCPLCLSGIVFDPIVQDTRVEFGTSGKLWNSNLLMYDRKTNSLWSQVLGEAVLGEMTGNQLTILPSDQMKYGEWVKQNPQGQVLSKDTGVSRVYGQDPYGDYYFTPGVFFPVDNRDDRLKEKDFVLGIVIDGKAKAYDPRAVKKAGEIEELFSGKTIVAKYEEDIDATRIYEKNSDGTLDRINPFTSFWFAWVAVHPDTELYK